MRAGRNQYAPMQGVLRAARGDRREVRVRSTAGATTPRPRSPSRRAAPKRSSTPSRRRCSPATRSIVLEPCYDSVRAGDRVERRRRRCSCRCSSPTTRSTGTRCGARSRPGRGMIMINSPHNPPGAVLTRRRHARSSTAIVERHAASSILSDEVYEHIIFDGLRHESMARARRARRAQLRRRLVRQDVSHDRVEGRLRGGAGGADGRVPQGAPVRDVLDEHAGPARDRRLPRDRARARRARRRSSRPSATCSSA